MKEARRTVDLWYNDRKEVLKWQEERKKEAYEFQRVHTLLGRARRFPEIDPDHSYHRGHIERAAINTPVQVRDLSNTFIQLSATLPFCLSRFSTLMVTYSKYRLYQFVDSSSTM